ncbi:ATP-dependent DNA helicase PIF1-like [Papaver somniferum]|uniref:ATP-dependent DNA helicase PIF1-like n=1 Tax=Papaver somniferum TaxID=3469 RepID=UPI000E6F4C53|nr:ATP-dependent DNA helicase PIF1-like [Papaver somniferum]
MGAIERKESKVFFIDGPGGTRNTYLYRSILATVRENGGIALATTTSGIAATMIPGGRTSHSRFQLPMTPTSTSTCRTKKQTEEAKLLRRATVLMWDEATMAHRYSLEEFDRTMTDITGIAEPFGGKILIMGDDFRQKNMRAVEDASYSEFLIRVGDGDEPCVSNEMIKVPEEMVIPWDSDASLSQLIDVPFPNSVENARDVDYMVNRALITPLNEYVEKLNDRVLNIFPGKEVLFYSLDSLDDDTHCLYQQEYLNNNAPGGLPSHILKLKIGAPIMLLRNVDAKNGLCNGTRLIIKEFFPNCIDVVIISGNYIGTRVFIHKMSLEPPENLNIPYKFKRKQFAICLCFFFTVNKAQGQTIENTGIFFPEHVFSHGQLYVALSRGVSSSNTKVLVAKGTIAKKKGTYMKNVMYKEVFLS